MRKWKVIFLLNGNQTEQVVSADTSFQAVKIIKASYPSSRIDIIRTQEVK